MTKESYLQALESLLKKHMSKSDIDDILRDYGEYFDDGRRQNKTDTEISAKLGDPEIIAQQFIEENGKDTTKGEKLDQTLHSIKEGTAKTFASLKKGTEKTLQLGEKVATSDLVGSAKQGASSLGNSVKKGTHSIGSVLKSIVLFFCFAFLQFLVLFVYGFGFGAAIFFVGCGIFGLGCLGFCFAFLPLLLSLACIFAILATFGLAGLITMLTLYILKENIRLLKNQLLPKNNTKEAV